MSLQKTTLNECLDCAVEKLGPVRRAIVKRRLKNPQYREAMLDEVREKLYDEPGCPAGLKAQMEQEGFGYNDGFELDAETIMWIIKMIVTWLPTIIKILAIFILAPLFLMFSLSLPAHAGRPPCDAIASQIQKKNAQYVLVLTRQVLCLPR